MSSHLLRIAYETQLNIRRWLTGRCCRMRKAVRRRAGSVPSIRERPPDRVLIILAGLIGDSVMCAPVLEEARRVWPTADITLLGQQHNCDLFSDCPHIDRLYTARVHPFSIRDRREFSSLRGWVAANNFDVGIILLGDDFAALLAEVGIPMRVGPQGTLLEPCLTHPYDSAIPRTWGPDEKLNALRSLGCEVRNIPPRLTVSDSSRISARGKLSRLGMSDGTRYAVIHPFGSELMKWWPFDRAQELAAALADGTGLMSVLIGGPEVRLRGAIPAFTRGIDAIGAFSLRELTAVIEGCTITITTDSGPFHIAGALGRPTVGLFRARRPEHAARYSLNAIVFGSDEECDEKCSWDRCRFNPCRQMGSITTSQVLRQIELLCQRCGEGFAG